MLLNLSNHSSKQWSDAQKNKATELFGSVVDMPFPQIDPNASADEVALLVEKYISEAKKQNPMAVHVMGEMTFVYRFVETMKSFGIPCYASTTIRKVVEKENGEKISYFDFVNFRNYF
jgi:hypothetical protein